jgi:hypothetical protein
MLGQALEKLGRGPDALKAYLMCERHLAETTFLTRTMKRIQKDLPREIERLGKGYAELRELDEAFVKDAVAFSRRYFSSDPGWAKKAAEAALAIDPGHKLAQGYLERLADVAGPTTGGVIFEPLISSDRLENFEPGITKEWSCAQGIVSVDIPEAKGRVNLVRTQLDGRYEIRAWFRVKRSGAVKRSFGLMLGNKPDGSAWGVLINWNDDLRLVKFHLGGKSEDLEGKILTGFIPDRWNLLHLRVSPGRIEVYIDRKLMIEHDGELSTAFDGTPGIFTQDGAFEIKDFGVNR